MIYLQKHRNYQLYDIHTLYKWFLWEKPKNASGHFEELWEGADKTG